ncbi:MAG: alkaline phosphatase [Bacillota bacterium]
MHGKRRLIWILVCVFLILSLPGFTGSGLAQEPEVRNVIVLVADGCGSAHTTLARWYKGAPLALDEIVAGGVITHSADSMITDSAPAATAFATGHKSDTKFISVLPAVIDVPVKREIPMEDLYRPVASVLEAAKLQGKSTGIIATSNVQHATPACYAAHWHDRNDYNEIAEQMVYEDVDVVLGGGKQYLLPAAKGGKRTDGEDLVAVLKSRGYAFVENTAAMQKIKAGKLWGLFAPNAMAHDFDRDPAKEPSLAQMTAKAIEILSKNPKGFFLFVEGSQIDWSSHANDPIGVISDVLAFDEAVKVAVDFAKRDGHTLVLAFTDHGNGGMSIGNKATDHGYDTLKPARVVGVLKKAKLTGVGLEAKLNADRSNIAEVMAAYYGINDLTPEEIETIKAARPGELEYVVGPMLSRRACIGWTTTGHTGEDVFLYAYGPKKPTGLLDNTEIARHIARAMKVDLDEVTGRLFTPVTAFEELGASVSVDAGTPNPVVTVKKGNVTMTLKASTDIATINGRTVLLEGPTIHLVVKNKQGQPVFEKTWVPRQAVELFREALKKAA